MRRGASPLRGMGGVEAVELQGEGGQRGWWAEVARSSALGFQVEGLGLREKLSVEKEN